MPAQCLSSESGGFLIPPLNVIAGALVKIKRSDSRGSNINCWNEYYITAGGEQYYVCEAKPGPLTMISGNHMHLNVTFVRKVQIFSNGGKDSHCTRVGKPFAVGGSIGTKLLNPPTLL